MVKNGHRLQPPENCPGVLAKLMGKCWENSPENRPNFKVEKKKKLFFKKNSRKFPKLFLKK